MKLNIDDEIVIIIIIYNYYYIFTFLLFLSLILYILLGLYSNTLFNLSFSLFLNLTQYKFIIYIHKKLSNKIKLYLNLLWEIALQYNKNFHTLKN
jgi:hypothetical protein